MRTNSRERGKVGKFQSSLRIMPESLLNFTAELCHRSRVAVLYVVFIARGFAPKAWAKSRFFRDRGLAEKCHLFASRSARRARWPTINSRRAHRINKSRIHSRVSRKNRLPATRTGNK